MIGLGVHDERASKEPRPSGKLAGAVAMAAAVVSVLGVVAGIWLNRIILARSDIVPFLSLPDMVVAATYPVVGAFLVRRRPDNAAGWLLVATSLLGVYVFAGEYAVVALVVEPGSLPMASVAAWVATWGWTPHLLLPTLLPLIFPDGRVSSPRWRRVAVIIGVSAAVITVCRMFAAVSADVSPRIDNPLGLTAALMVPVAVGAMSIFLVGGPTCVACLVMRQRRAVGTERAQLQWLLVGFIAALVGGVAQLPLSPPADEVAFAAGLAMVPVTMVIAIVRHRLLDIEVVLNRALVYSALSGLVLLSYVGAVAAVGELAFGRRLALAVVALAALVAASVRDRVQLLVDRLLYGARRDPYTVVSRVGGRLDLATGPLEALTSLVEEVREALKLPYVAVVPTGSLPPVTVGTAVATVETVPVLAQGNEVGVLEVGHRHDGERFRTEERSVLADVARRAGALVQAADLLDSLQRSRERLVVAREEERRRLRHDLHDGLGPDLAGLALHIDSLAGRVGDHPDLGARVARLQNLARRAVTDVRRIVEDLRPAALDELGLAGALREHTADFPGVRVETAGDLSDLPAAMEVAAYRIASEAVTNAARHAQAEWCLVHLAIEEDCLVVEIRDNGRGIPSDASPGVGLRSMHDRAAEVGGVLEVLALGDAGTAVRARLPLEGR